MKRLARAIAGPLSTLVLAVMGIVGPALAQQPTQAQINAIRQACRADYQAHCSNVPTGGPEALTCLKENSAGLSTPCQRAVAAVGGSAPSGQGRKQAASPAAPPAPSPTARAPAAPAYQAPPAPMTPRMEASLLRRACGEDFRAYCGEVPPGGGRIIACLEENRSNLSRQCRSAIASARRGQ